MPPVYNFYPGPSKIDADCAQWFSEAVSSGIAYANHRSAAFEELYAATKTLLRRKLGIPEDYEICLLSSATQGWQSVLLSYPHHRPVHIYNGSFGEKWAAMAEILHLKPLRFPFDINTIPTVPALAPAGRHLICTVDNETSNGTALPAGFLRQLRAAFPHDLVAVDAVSSMAGIHLDWESGDLWLASVQKCFGLPAGMALLICSPRAAECLPATAAPYYDSIHNLFSNAQKNQTVHTPNVPGLYLLYRRMQKIEPIKQVSKQLEKRLERIYCSFANYTDLTPLITEPAVRSTTVAVFTISKEQMRQFFSRAAEQGIIPGKGYGKWKDDTVRIANFPAIEDADYEDLFDFLKNYKS